MRIEQTQMLGQKQGGMPDMEEWICFGYINGHGSCQAYDIEECEARSSA